MRQLSPIDWEHALIPGDFPHETLCLLVYCGQQFHTGCGDSPWNHSVEKNSFRPDDYIRRGQESAAEGKPVRGPQLYPTVMGREIVTHDMCARGLVARYVGQRNGLWSRQSEKGRHVVHEEVGPIKIAHQAGGECRRALEPRIDLDQVDGAAMENRIDPESSGV